MSVVASTENGMDRLNTRVWIDSIKRYGSTQDVIDSPHCIHISKYCGFLDHYDKIGKYVLILNQ